MSCEAVCESSECGYSSDTEVMSLDGWKPMLDLKFGDHVLVWCDDGSARYYPIEGKLMIPYKGVMKRFKRNDLDLLVTPNHKMIACRKDPRNRTYYPWKLVDADQISGDGWFFTRLCKFDNVPVSKSLDWIRMLGYYLGDGSCYLAERKRNYTIKFAAIKERKRRYIENVLSRLNYNYRYDGRSYVVLNKSLYTELKPLGNFLVKHIPPCFKNASREQLLALWEGLLNSDGCQTTQSYATSSPQLARDVQEVLCKLGFPAIVRVREASKQKASIKADGSRIEAKHDSYVIRATKTRERMRMRRHSYQNISYSGNVVNIMAGNRPIYVRRENKPLWGSSYQNQSGVTLAKGSSV